MQYLYAVEMSGFEDTKEHHKNLIKSIDSIHELFLFQISLFVEILKKAKSKYNISLESVTGNISSKYTTPYIIAHHNNKEITVSNPAFCI